MSRVVPIPLACLLALCASGRAQTLEEIRESLRQSARATRFPLFVIALTDMAQASELSGSRLRVDDEVNTELTTFSLPWRSNFLEVEDGTSLRVEGTLGYADASLEVEDIWSGVLPGFETRIDTDYEAVAADLGVGPSFPLGDTAGVVELLAHGTLAYVHNDTDYAGPGAAFTQAITDGILFDWDGWYWGFGGSLGVRPELRLFDDIETRPLLRYDIRRIEGLDVDDPAQDASETTQWATLRLDLEGDTGLDMFGTSVRWLGDVGYRHLFGDAGTVLGINDFWEIGTGVAWDTPEAVPVLSELKFGVAVQFADNLFGWSIGFSASF